MPMDTNASDTDQFTNSDREWNALYTKHQHEKVVAESLQHRELEVFLPTCRRVHRWQDRTKHLELPLFPCYVFVRTVLSRQTEILSVAGVFSIVACAGRPTVIEQSEIDVLRQVCKSRVEVKPHPFLKFGDRVRVTHGPLEGVEGLLERSKSSSRLVVSVNLLGLSAAVEIEAASVELVTSFAHLPKTDRFSGGFLPKQALRDCGPGLQ